MIRPGAIVFRITHEPVIAYEWLIADGEEPQWGSNRAAALFFDSHRAADERARQLRTSFCFVSSMVIEHREEPQLPREFLEREQRPARHRRIRGPRPDVALFGYKD